ncbi:COMM domain-containing protein 7 [Theropithecus gelada]|uniref:COMM domain-containing protein 7 n=1 Tax=Theropithecus gelada TaxID=9565 RepID=UPI000DC1755C|nr:COMM domain-containing protein 7 [Theropithecus gelada]
MESLLFVPCSFVAFIVNNCQGIAWYRSTKIASENDLVLERTWCALKKSLTAKQVQADFITLGLSEEKATYFSEKWKQNAPTLAQWAIGQTLMINQLIDMEWKFGVTSGSSELEKVGSIFLQLKLVVKKGNQTENVYIELTLPQFYSFLHEMERVRTSMECFC